MNKLNSHLLDEDFQRINDLFDEYAKSVNYDNVADFKSALKTKLTITVWKTLNKIPANRKLLNNNPDFFIQGLNDCLNACLNRIKNGNFTVTFSQYIYNTIPKRIKQEVNEEKISEKRSSLSDNDIKKMREISKCYKEIEKFGSYDESTIIRKIAKIKGINESKVIEYLQMEKNSKNLYVEHEYAPSNDDYDKISQNIIDISMSKSNYYKSPVESSFFIKDSIKSLFRIYEKYWEKIVKDNYENIDENLQFEQQFFSKILTMKILKNFTKPYEEKYCVENLSTVKFNIDFKVMIKKYKFFNKEILDLYMNEKDFPSQMEIANEYYPDITKSALSHKINRFMEKVMQDKEWADIKEVIEIS